LKLLEIGYVAKVFGLNGELKLGLHWEGSDALEHARDVVLSKGDRSVEFALSGVRGTSKAPIIRLEGVDDRTQAEAWKGAAVSVERQQLPPLEPGEYYLSDLVGAQVTDSEGTVGAVEAIGIHPSVDTLVIRTPDGKLVEQPLVDEWLEEVDAVGRRVVLTSREGLIE
jgi:16S rRNA processing protein RimM